MAVKLVTDSTSYMPLEVRDRLDISVVALSVDLEGQTFDDDAPDHSPFYKALAATKAFPTSSQPSVSDLVDVFTRLASERHQVVGVFLSSAMSGTHSTAMLARDMVLETMPEASIDIVDSRSNCMELGFAVLAGAELAENGAALDEVLAAIDARIARTRFLFVPDTLEYLRRGGRIGGASALLGSLLQIRPILTVVDGKTDVFAKVRTKKKALAEIVEAFKRDIEQKGGLGGVAVHHIDDVPEGRATADMISSLTGGPVELMSIGPVIGTHVGPGTVGLVYHTVEEMHK